MQQIILAVSNYILFLDLKILSSIYYFKIKGNVISFSNGTTESRNHFVDIVKNGLHIFFLVNALAFKCHHAFSQHYIIYTTDLKLTNFGVNDEVFFIYI